MKADGEIKVDVADLPYIAQWYLRFAETQAAGQSALYEGWARGVAHDEAVLVLLVQLPRPKRQPILVFAVSRLLGVPEADYSVWRQWMLANWPVVRAEVLHRATQTNEPGRCAAILPLLATIPGPIGLLEVGTAAGLCLYPDSYSYSYSYSYSSGDGDGDSDSDSSRHVSARELRLDPATGASTVVLDCTITGAHFPPPVMPQVLWRAGIDLAPLDVSKPDDVRWLDLLVWPEQQARRIRIGAAAEIVRSNPPRLVQGDATQALIALAAQCPPDVTLVVIAAGTLVYLSAAQREEFISAVHQISTERRSGARWISLEGPAVLPAMAPTLVAQPAAEPGQFVLGLDGMAVAWCGPHGQNVHWFER